MPDVLNPLNNLLVLRLSIAPVLLACFALTGYFNPLPIHPGAVSSETVSETSIDQNTQVCHVWGSALLREGPTTKVYTPVFTVRTRHNDCQLVRMHMESRLRNHIEGVMGRSVYATYGHSDFKRADADSYREEQIARDRRSRQPAAIMYTTSFSFSYSD